MAAITSVGSGVWSAAGTWDAGVPGEGDTAQIANTHTVTIDATITVGADTSTPAIDVLSGGTLAWDNLGDDVLTLKGNLAIRSGGTLTLNGTTNPGNQLTIKQNYSDSLSSYKYYIQPFAGCTFDLDGADKTRLWDTITTADATTSTIDTTNNNETGGWLVGDTVGVNSVERTISTISGTQITLSGNVTFVTGDYIVNRSCNIKITAYNTNYPTPITSNGAFIATMDWVEIEYAAPSRGVIHADSTSNVVTFNNCVIAGLSSHYGLLVAGTVTVNESLFYKCSHYPYLANSTAYLTFTDNFDYYSSGSYSLCGVAKIATGTITGNIVKGTTGTGLYHGGDITYSNNTHLGTQLNLNTITKLTATNNTVTNATTALTLTNVYSGEMTDSTLNGNTTDVIYSDFVNCKLGNCTFQTPPVITASSFKTGGLYIHKINGVTGTHKTYKKYGTYEKQSTTKYAGSNALKMNPNSATNKLIASGSVFAINTETVAYSAYFRKDVAMAVLPYLKLSGAGITASTATMVNTQDNWQLLTVSGVATENGFCKVEFVCQNASGNVYVDDDQDSFNYWFEGDIPAVVPKPSLTATDMANLNIIDVSWSSGTFGDVIKKGSQLWQVILRFVIGK